ncbi:MAG: hypothetical protein KAU21_20200 [Gammaproteobacteria bacterium]|nr:hypothetical protein [Gammaproteobacteria bacterium]
MNEADISKMGSAKVVKTSFNGVDAIVKSGTNKTEYYFYTEIAEMVELEGLHTPKLLGHSNNDSFRVVIEHIPNKFDHDDWKDKRILRNISYLHKTKLDIDHQQLFKFNWTEEKTLTALPLFDRKQQTDIENLLQIYHLKSAEIFEPICPVSGDTNFNNWGKRNNGEAVLFDWERFGFASPAIDLAPLIPGLPSIELISQYCDEYTKLANKCSVTSKELRTHVIISLAWIVIEVVNILLRRNKPSLQRTYMEWFDKVYLNWLSVSKKTL